MCHSESIHSLIAAIQVAQACCCDSLRARLTRAAACQAKSGGHSAASSLSKEAVAALGSDTLAELLLQTVTKFARSQPVPICEVLPIQQFGHVASTAATGGPLGPAGAPPLAGLAGVPGLVGGSSSPGFYFMLRDFSKRSGFIKSPWVEVGGLQWRIKLLLGRDCLSGEGWGAPLKLSGVVQQGCCQMVAQCIVPHILMFVWMASVDSTEHMHFEQMHGCSQTWWLCVLVGQSLLSLTTTCTITSKAATTPYPLRSIPCTCSRTDLERGTRPFPAHQLRLCLLFSHRSGPARGGWRAAPGGPAPLQARQVLRVQAGCILYGAAPPRPHLPGA